MANQLRRNAPSFLDIRDLHEKIDGITDYNAKIYRAAQWYAANKIAIVPFLKSGYPKDPNQPPLSQRPPGERKTEIP